MNAWQAFHFLRPWWLLALLVLPLWPWGLQRVGESASLRRLVDARLMPYLVHGGERRRWGVLAGVMTGWALACLAMAGPTWERLPQPVFASQSAQVIAVSMSQRMLAQDLTPNRLTRVRYKIHALLDANRAGQNGLIAYAGAAFTVAPLTTDTNALTELVDSLAPDTMPISGDDAAAAIRRATDLLQGAGMRKGSIVVIDDHADQQALDAARAARAAGMRVSVLGVGTDKGAPVPSRQGGFEQAPGGHTLMARRDGASLRALASAGGGRYVGITPGPVDVHALASQLRVQTGVRDARHPATTWRDRGAWLLLPLLVLVAFGFRRGALFVLPWLLLPLWPTTAHASAWQDAWRTRDQQAARALARGHARQAQELARSPALRGTAAYRAGDYRTAAQAFARARGAQNIYNRGNALARMHRYREAVKAYDQALAADPHLHDARVNRQAVLDWLRKQKKHASQGDGKGAQGAGNGSPKDHSGQGRQDKQHRSAGQSNRDEHKGKPGDDEGRRKSGEQGDRSGDRQGRQQAGRKKAPGDDGGDAKARKSAASRADDAKARERARQALKRQLQKQDAKHKPQRPYALGSKKPGHNDKGKPLPSRMREALERVPDDPGGLLRNKFMLEYQRRLQRGEAQPQPDGGQ